jgi:hypothetical protein
MMRERVQRGNGGWLLRDREGQPLRFKDLLLCVQVSSLFAQAFRNEMLELGGQRQRRPREHESGGQEAIVAF